MNRILLILWLLMDAAIVYGTKEIRKCNTARVFSEQFGCPQESMCIASQANSDDGLCICNPDTFQFNPNYTNDTDYCIKLINNNNNNNIHNNNPSSSSSSTTNAHSSNSKNSDNNNPLPGAHHVAAGIFLPILSVCILIGGIFAFRKLHITQRIRNFRRNRRSRPFYGDVSLEENLPHVMASTAELSSNSNVY